MHFHIFDDNVSTTMNIFLVIGNIINLIYNIPQMVKTYKSKTTGDFSPTFLFMRIVGNTIWLAYSIELNEFLFIVSNIVSVFSSIFIGYFKVAELYKNRNYTTHEINDNENGMLNGYEIDAKLIKVHMRSEADRLIEENEDNEVIEI
jgi:uncharacterized protein with PQ loop repeat